VGRPTISGDANDGNKEEARLVAGLQVRTI
jgi:hypothetical protein